MRKLIDVNEATIVALGSNLAGEYPSCRALLEAALARFSQGDLKIVGRSRWWRSSAWPRGMGPDYLNGVVVVETSLPPKAVLFALLNLEAAFGRRRGLAHAPRTLDLDLIAHGRAVIEESGLALPHPRATQRRFVMGPLAEIAPHWTHPLDGKTAAEHAESAHIGLDARPILDPDPECGVAQ